MELEKIKMYSIRAHEIATAHAHWLCLVVSEVMEAVEADRKDYRADMIGFIQNTYLHPDFAERYETYIKGSVEEELADAVIRIFDLIGEKYPDMRLGDVR